MCVWLAACAAVWTEELLLVEAYCTEVVLSTFYHHSIPGIWHQSAVDPPACCLSTFNRVQQQCRLFHTTVSLRFHPNSSFVLLILSCRATILEPITGTMIKNAVRHIKYNKAYTPFWNSVSFVFDWYYRASYSLIEKSSRISVIVSSEVKKLQGKPVIYINWHTHLPFVIHYMGRNRINMLVSGAPYMNPVVRWCESSGLKIIRGASGEAGDSKRLLRNVLESGESVVLAVDGPAGPIYKVKRGCIDLAKDTGCPIVHLYYSSKKGRANISRWDRMLHPSIFDDITFVYSDPIYIPADMSTEQGTKLIEDKYFKRFQATVQF